MASTAAAAPEPKPIALVIGSTRNPRVGPSLAKLILDSMRADASSSSAAGRLEILDIADFDLPLFDEPGIPMRTKASEDYAHAHTRAWSAAVSAYSAFVFLTPQYNWSVPAALKNALDFLFNEWAGKPALVLSYGGRGGGRAAAHLLDILQAFRMKPLPETVGFAMHGIEGALEASAAGRLVDAAPAAWAEELEKTRALFLELCKQA